MIPQNTYCSIYSLKKKNWATIISAQLCLPKSPVLSPPSCLAGPCANYQPQVHSDDPAQVPAPCENASLNRGRGARGGKSSASGLEGLLAMKV